MKFISICSGIEAASVAWQPLGWEALSFSEIEPFPSALLAHHYLDVPNFGDMSKFREWPEEIFLQADVIVGGPPCQSFSVAGKREGLSDERGNLTLIYTELIDHADAIRLKHGKQPVIIVYENVPGLLSDKTNAFGCFLAALAGEDEELQPTGKRWSDAGVVLGPQRAVAWRILNAQYFGLAQRRRRVFVVASARAGFDPAEVLFEFEGVRRDSAPSRESGQETTGNVGAGAKTASHWDGVENPHPTLSQSHNTGGIGASNQELFSQGGAGLVHQEFRELTTSKWPADIASTLNASFGSKLGLENQHIDGGAPLFVPAQAFGIPGNWIGRKPENGGNSTQFMHEIAPNQTATDRHGVVAFAQNTRDEVRFIGGDGQVAGALAANPGMKQTTYLAFNSRQDPVSGEIAGALDTCSPQAQAIAIQGSVIGRKPENGPQGSGYDDTGVCFTQTAIDRHAVATQTAVRRLTPTECERLQGFPEVKKSIIINIVNNEIESICYLDPQKSNANAETRCLRSQSNVLSAEEEKSKYRARSAEQNLSAPQAELKKHAQVTVLIDLEQGILQILNQKKPILNVRIAEKQRLCPLYIQPEDFVQLSVAILSELEKKVQTGKEGSHQNIISFITQKSGRKLAGGFGLETEEYAKDVEKLTSEVKNHMKFTTSEVGSNFQSSEQKLAILFYCVTSAINLYIQGKTNLGSSYSLKVETTIGYTAIPWRNKPAEECPDGHRYKALGNSMAVPVMRWIGERIDRHLDGLDSLLDP